MGRLWGKGFIPVRVNLMQKFLPSEQRENEREAALFMSVLNPATTMDALPPVQKH
jgi:hypothetical protein